MEFLVKIEDKINPQTWCFNPIHKGEKIVFDDNTFQAPCKECGETKYLYRKNNAITKKGHFITFKEDGWTWGDLEIKHYGIVKIDCTYEQAQEWCSGIQNEVLRVEIEQLRRDFTQQMDILMSLLSETDKSFLKFFPKSPESEAIRERINNDGELLVIKEQEKQKQNQCSIEERPRKFKFDYESCVPAENNWKDLEKDSKIFNLTDTTFIKEIVFAKEI